MEKISKLFTWMQPGLDFISVSLSPFLDFLLIAILIYCVLYFIRGTRGASVLAGIIIALLSLTSLAKGLKFEVLSWLLDNFWTIAAVSIVVIFQPELRRAFAQLGSKSFSHRSDMQKKTIQEVVKAARALSRTRTGALIVFERQIGMASIKNSAVELDAKVNSVLLQSLFYPNSPLHDGAVIINGDTIQAAHAILPLTLQPEYAASQSIGTRHRAAVGVTEETDAIAIVCSEETGGISVAMKGVLERHITPERLGEILTDALMDVHSKNTKAQENEEAEDATL